jgi:hypothetical protein
MLVALAISHLPMPSALTLQAYHYLCLWLVRNINKNPISLSFSLVETGVPGEKPLQAKLKADYFSLSLFFYLQCLKRAKQEMKRRKNVCHF